MEAVCLRNVGLRGVENRKNVVSEHAFYLHDWKLQTILSEQLSSGCLYRERQVHAGN